MCTVEDGFGEIADIPISGQAVVEFVTSGSCVELIWVGVKFSKLNAKN